MNDAPAYTACLDRLRRDQRRWLVTGAAGFIGSHLVETLLSHGQEVIGLDNLDTGFRHNLDVVLEALPAEARRRFAFVEADIRDFEACRRAAAGCDAVLHHAALGSVPRSIENPLEANAINVDGFVNVLTAARDAGVGRVVYASSSAVYGDDPADRKREDALGRALSPYATSKRIDELWADVFALHYGVSAIGLRYFNVFGPRQDPNGAYAAVIPKWIVEMLAGRPVTVNGDGETSRDFCHVDNVVQANLLAALAPEESAGTVYNVAVGGRTTLNELHEALRAVLAEYGVDAPAEPIYGPFRDGDIRHSLADVSSARAALGYRPTYDLRAGLKASMPSYLADLADSRAAE